MTKLESLDKTIHIYSIISYYTTFFLSLQAVLLVVWITSVNTTSCNLLPHLVVAIQVMNSVKPKKILYCAFRPEKDFFLSFPGTNALHLSSSQVVQHRDCNKVEILFYIEVWYLAFFYVKKKIISKEWFISAASWINLTLWFLKEVCRCLTFRTYPKPCQTVTQSSGGVQQHMEGKKCIYPSHSELLWWFFHSHNPLLLTEEKKPQVHHIWKILKHVQCLWTCTQA